MKNEFCKYKMDVVLVYGYYFDLLLNCFYLGQNIEGLLFLLFINFYKNFFQVNVLIIIFFRYMYLIYYLDYLDYLDLYFFLW